MAVIPCTTSAPVRGIVTFSPAAFRLLYPEFTGLSDAQLNQSFALAQLGLNNSCASRVQDANNRDTLLNILVAHISFLAYGLNDGAGIVVPAPGIVGRIDAATEGAVSVDAVYEAPPNGSMAYFVQTKYGAQFWQFTAQYRTFIYAPPPPDPCLGVGFFGGPFGGGGCGC